MPNTIKLANWGNSVALRIPKSILSEVGLTEKSEVTLIVTKGGIIIKPCKKHTPLAERFAGYDGGYSGETLDWGGDVGGEVCD